VRVCIADGYDRRRSYKEALAAAQAEIENLAELAQAHGRRALIETQPGTIASSASAAARLVGNVSPEHIGILYDPANTFIEGQENPRMAVEVMGAHLAHVHVKNIGWSRAGDEGWRWTYEPLDAGMVDWETVMRCLDSVGFSGCLSIEDMTEFNVETTGLLDSALRAEAVVETPPKERLIASLGYLRSLEGTKW